MSIIINAVQLKTDCHQSIVLRTRSVAIFSGGKDIVGLEFWNDFWYYPDTVSDYIKRTSSGESYSSDTRIWYIGAAYISAFEDILDFLSDQIQKSAIFGIPTKGLKPEEIRAFDDARLAYSDGEYDIAASIISDLVETKIREFLYNVFSLQHGECHFRLHRITEIQIGYIRENISKGVKNGLSSTDNEFSYLNRHDYKPIFCGPSSPGNKNWAHTLSKIFFDWKEPDVLLYLDKFAKLNLQSSHHKQGVLTQEQQVMIYEFLIKSIDFVKRINGSYIMLLNAINKTETHGIPRYNYYSSLEKCKDLQELTPINIPVEDARRILEQWKSVGVIHVDLSNRQQIEQKYSVAYREFYAIFSALLIQAPSDIQVKIINDGSPQIVFETKVIQVTVDVQPNSVSPVVDDTSRQ